MSFGAATGGIKNSDIKRQEAEALARARLKRLREANARASATQTRRGPTLAGNALVPDTVVRQSLLGGAGDSQSLLAGA